MNLDRSTLVPWPQPWPPTGFLLCPDCASTVEVLGTPDHRVMAGYVHHSTTCPAWTDPDPEQALVILPGGGR